MAAIHMITQINSSSGLPVYLGNSLAARGHGISYIDTDSCLFNKLRVLIQSFHPDKKKWFRRRAMLGTYSVAAWQRNTRLNGKLLDRVCQPHDKVLQIGGLFAPHPRLSGVEYYLFFTYTMKLAFRDGHSPWVPAPHERSRVVELEKNLYAGARHIFVSAEFVRRHLIGEYRIPADRISVVGMGVDDFFIRNMRLSLPSRPSRKCLFVGYTFHLKGGPDVLRAFALARRQLPDLELIIIGPDKTDEMDQEGVRHVGSVKNREELLEYYRSADLFLLPSRCDSFGFVFLEAMSQGLTCIGSSINAMPEIIADGETGFVVDPGDHHSLAGRIVQFYADPRLRVAMGQRARERVLERFTWPRVVEAMETIMFT